MRIAARVPIGVALAAGLVIGACTGGTASPSPAGSSAAATSSAKPTTRLGSFDRPVVLAFTPSQEASTIATNGGAIKAALEKATGLSWKVTAMSSYSAQVEGMCAGSIDVGFFAPLQMTLLLGKGCGSPVLAALRNDETGKPATSYKSQILVRADSGINDLNGLKGKKFAFVDTLSASGYVFPTLTVKQKTGQDPKTFFSNTTFAGSHPAAALAVYNGQVDGAATFIDVRTQLVGANPDIMTKTKVIDTAGPIPNDGVALRKDFPADLGKTVAQALQDYAKTDGGKTTLKALFSWDGMQAVDASFYNSMKEAAALAGVDVEGLAKATPRPPATPSPSKAP